MRQIVYDQEEECLAWAADRIHCRGFGPHAHAIGVRDDHGLCAVTAWDDFSPWNCMMHIASDSGRRWMTREFLFRSFAYPFLQLDLRRVTGLIAADNEASLHLAERVGFVVECPRVQQAFGERDGVLLRMLRAECRWVPPEQMAA